MPELPDVQAYLVALERNLGGRRLAKIRLKSPFLVRTVDPPLREAEGRRVIGFERLGKRIVLRLEGKGAQDASPRTVRTPEEASRAGQAKSERPPAMRTRTERSRTGRAGGEPARREQVEDELSLVFHLMIAGRFRWQPAEPPGRGESASRARSGSLRGKIELAALDFENGTLLLTEAGTKKRASLHLVRGAEALQALDPGGLEVLEADLDAFRARLQAENHTLKRTLCDPKLFSGIGNAYSDEILHRARLSPLAWTSRLGVQEVERLYESTQSILRAWIERIALDADEHGFPRKVTAFREGMAVHGRFKEPCPDCGAPVQRIVHADNETNYCARCQTGGKLLKDRALSRLLRDDWPRSLDEL